MSKEVLIGRIQAFAPIVIALLGIINMILQSQNLPSLEIGDAQITTFINSLAAIVGSIYGWWFNNNVTQNAKMSQEVLNGLKDGSVTSQQVESILPEQVVVK